MTDSDAPRAGRRPEDLFDGHPRGLGVLRAVQAIVEGLGGCQTRASRSQVAFRRRRGFAYVWRPGQYLSRTSAEAIISVVLGRRDGSPRWKEVVHPSPAHWMHHLEVRDATEVDDEVAGWLREAADQAG